MWKQGVYTGSEQESLHISLQRHRDAARWKIEGHTARHAGHMDILRELIDGQIGDRPGTDTRSADEQGLC